MNQHVIRVYRDDDMHAGQEYVAVVDNRRCYEVALIGVHVPSWTHAVIDIIRPIETPHPGLLDNTVGALDGWHYLLSSEDGDIKEVRNSECLDIQTHYKFILFDADGTLVTTKSGATFRKTADDWQMLPGREEKCDELREQDILLGLASNQAGVAFPWSTFTENEIRVQLTALSMLIDGCYTGVCCSSPNEKALPAYFHTNDPRRKPNPGMILEGMQHVGVGPEDTLFVGDRLEDEQAAQAAGVDFQWADTFFT